MYKNKEHRKYHSDYRDRNKQIIREKTKKYYKENPWMRSYNCAKQRCNNPNNQGYKDYGERRILFLISKEEIEFLWFRDKAYNMIKSSIDRIENDGNYELSNCRFIELGKNVAERNIRVLSKRILQYDLQENFIKEWFGIRNVSKELNINQSNITKCAKGEYKTSGGFIWRYKNE